MRWIVADASFASVNAAGFSCPLDESAATADPSVTGSNSASWRVPSRVLTVTTKLLTTTNPQIAYQEKRSCSLNLYAPAGNGRWTAC